MGAVNPRSATELHFYLCVIFIFLAGDIGGIMGLLLGASVLTIFELLDLILYNSLRKWCNVRNLVMILTLKPLYQEYQMQFSY